MRANTQSRYLDNLFSKDINKTDSLGNLVGLWVHYCCNSHSLAKYIEHHIGHYIDSREEGLWQTFKGKRLQAEAYFKRGKMDGDAFIYNNRRLFAHLKLAADKLDGECRIFSKRGKLIGLYVYKNDKLLETLCFRHNDCNEEHFDLKKMVPYFHQ